MMRHALPWLCALLVLPTVAAIEQQHTIYLHEYSGGLHVVPEQIHAKVGDVLRLTVVNQGASPHNFLVCGDGANPLEKCDDRWGFTGMLQANASAPVTATVKESGTFDYYCYIPGHKGAGMGGKLTVADEETKKTPSLAVAPLMGAAIAVLLLARRRRDVV